MREVDGAGLARACADPLLRHWLDPARVARAWVEETGVAAVVEQTPGWRGAPAGLATVLAIGPASTLGPLLVAAEPLIGPVWRVLADAAAADVLPERLRPRASHDWYWMSTRTVPASGSGGVVPLGEGQLRAVDEVLALTLPDSFARRDLTASQWYGAHDPTADGPAADGPAADGPPRLLAVGALDRMPDGSGRLGGIAVRPSHRRLGLGEAVSAELTRRALDGRPDASGVAMLGVYTDNPAAIALYRRLGYRVGHHFVAGLV